MKRFMVNRRQISPTKISEPHCNFINPSQRSDLVQNANAKLLTYMYEIWYIGAAYTYFHPNPNPQFARCSRSRWWCDEWHQSSAPPLNARSVGVGVKVAVLRWSCVFCLFLFLFETAATFFILNCCVFYFLLVCCGGVGHGLDDDRRWR